jgi:hypothetical protein
MDEEFDTIIQKSYEEEGTLDRKLSDVLSVTRVPDESKFAVMYLAEFVSSMPGMEIWGSMEDPLNPELTQLFEPFAFPEESWREAVAVGSEFGILRARMFGNGEMLAVEVRPNYVPFCVENQDFINAILAAVSFNKIRETVDDPELHAYEDDHIAALGVFGDWRKLAFDCIEQFANWGDVAVNMTPIMSKCYTKYNLGDLKEHPWLVNGDAIWSILKDAGLFSGNVQAAKLSVNSALNLCLLGGNFVLAEKIASVFND